MADKLAATFHGDPQIGYCTARSTTPGTTITTEGVQTGAILICELGADTHDLHRNGEWQWNSGQWLARIGPSDEQALRDHVTDLLSDVDHFTGCHRWVEGDGTCTCLIGRLTSAIEAGQVSAPREDGAA